MLIFPTIDPVAFHLGPLPVHWYGLMYLIAFIGCWKVLQLRLRFAPQGFTSQQVSDVFFYIALGVILGGRLGYMLFYDLNDVIHHPLRIFMVWQGGMSFHGGLLGVMLAMWLSARRFGSSFFELADWIAPSIPVGLAAGRIGNFINGELWGRVTDMPWGVVFPRVDEFPRHPSQLYELFFEGIVMFTILWIYSRKSRPRGAVSGLFLVLYGVFRIGIEFFREPDAPIGYLAWGWVTEGQLLSLPMIFFGAFLLARAYRGKQLCSNI